MGWLEGIVGVAILMVIGTVFRFLNSRISELDAQKVNATLCEKVMDTQQGAIQEVKAMLVHQATSLDSISRDLSLMVGWLSAHGFPGQSLDPGPNEADNITGPSE